MTISEQEFPNLVFHGKLTGAGFLVPFKINDFIFLPLPVGSDRVVFLQCGEEMLFVFFCQHM